MLVNDECEIGGEKSGGKTLDTRKKVRAADNDRQ
jgi:hypothetical protein